MRASLGTINSIPKKAERDEILLDARILAVADVMEAMASHRPYRASLGIEPALEEIEKTREFFMMLP